MGCDIHVHIEVRHEGAWFHYATPRVDRNYRLFSLMAGIRSEDTGIQPIFPVRGLPTDCSPITAWEYEQDTLRFTPKSTSVIVDNELPELQRAYCEVSNTSLVDLTTDLEWTVFHTFVQGSSMAHHPEYDGLRIIFWFDG